MPDDGAERQRPWLRRPRQAYRPLHRNVNRTPLQVAEANDWLLRPLAPQNASVTVVCAGLAWHLLGKGR